MRNLAILIIAVSVGAISIVIFAQVKKQSKLTPMLATGDVRNNGSASSSETENFGNSIHWYKSLSQAMAEAQTGNKIIVVDVYTDWCGWCKKMDQTIYPDPKVVKLSRNTIFLKFDAEDEGEGSAFAKRMGVRGYPTTIILNRDGQKIVAKAGYPRISG